MYSRVTDREDGEHEEESLKSRHHCTDCGCFLVFLVAIAAFAGLYGFAVSKTEGSLDRLFHGIDDRGRICGVDEDVADKPLLLWCQGSASGIVSAAAKGDLSSVLAMGRRICVSACPGSSDDLSKECSVTSRLLSEEGTEGAVAAGGGSPSNSSAPAPTPGSEGGGAAPSEGSSEAAKEGVSSDGEGASEATKEVAAPPSEGSSEAAKEGDSSDGEGASEAAKEGGSSDGEGASEGAPAPDEKESSGEGSSDASSGASASSGSESKEAEASAEASGKADASDASDASASSDASPKAADAATADASSAQAKALADIAQGGYGTKEVLNRYCVPDLSKHMDSATEMMSSQMGGSDERIAQVISSIPAAWPAILGALVLAVALGYINLFLLRCCAVCILWICISLTIVGFGALGTFLWFGAETEAPISRLSAHMRSLAASNASAASDGVGDELAAGDLEDEVMYYHIAAIVCWVLSFLTLCLACFLRSSIDAAAACMEVACEAIFEMPSLLLAPVVKVIVKTAMAVGLLYGFALLWSIGDTAAFNMELPLPGQEGEAVDADAPHISHSMQQNACILFYMFVAFWLLGYVSALYEFVVAYAVATYYYAPHEEDEDGHFFNSKDVSGFCVALEGLHVGLFYHTGSLAFGSMLIAILQVIQKVIEYAELKNEEAGDNQVVSCVLCACSCCVHCLKDIVGFINRNAYIDIVINSNSFCEAAQRAMQMVIELGGAMAILNGATYIFAVFGTLLITAACAAGTYAIVDYGPFADPTSTFYVADPLAAGVVGALVGFPVALAFMDIFDMASDTLLYCYGSDLQSHKEDHNAPLELRELLEKYGHHDGDHTSG